MKTVSVNRKAYHDYEVLETAEAGLVLKGSEIKAIREGRINLREAFAGTIKGELWLYNAHIAQYSKAGLNKHEPTRPRKLLLHREEIDHLAAEVGQKGYTLVPLKLYFKKHVAKVELGLVRGRRVYDKREVIAKRDAEREKQRAIKSARG